MGSEGTDIGADQRDLPSILENFLLGPMTFRTMAAGLRDAIAL